MGILKKQQEKNQEPEICGSDSCGGAQKKYYSAQETNSLRETPLQANNEPSHQRKARQKQKHNPLDSVAHSRGHRIEPRQHPEPHFVVEIVRQAAGQ